MSCRLIISGEGPKRELLETMAKNLKIDDAVSMPGWVANPWKYLWRSSLFALASRWEGWPSAVVEAMTCGLPVITTDCPGGAKEMIEHGKSGVIVPTDDTKALKDAILDVLKNPAYRERLSEHAYRKSLNYDCNIIAPRYIDFAKAVMKVNTSKRELSLLR